MRELRLKIGTIQSLQLEQGTGAVQFGGSTVLFYLKDGYGLLLDQNGLSFATEKLKEPVSVGETIACDWTGRGTVSRWTYASTYQYAQSEFSDARDMEFANDMADALITDLIIPRVRRANPDLVIPGHLEPAQAQELNRLVNAVCAWTLIDPKATNELRDRRVDGVVRDFFAKRKVS